ncbi:MAG: hypothetical protein MJ211_04285 [Bacteroidales bacterium]|nr:hypothetical protein [Bacteroidales bacterium]
MKKLCITQLLLFISLSVFSQEKTIFVPQNNQDNSTNLIEFNELDNNQNSKNSFKIYYKSEKNLVNLINEVEKYNAKIEFYYDSINAISICIPNNMDIDTIISYFKSLKYVENVEKEKLYKKPKLH